MIWWGIVCFAIFGIGVVKSGFGSGMGLMLVPIMALAMDHIPGRGAGAALGLMLPLLLCGDLLAVWQYRHLFSLKIVKQLLPGSAVGLVLGGLLIWKLKTAGSERVVQSLIKTEIGFESVILVGLHWYRLSRGQTQKLMREPLRSRLTGCFAAVSSTLANAAGPIIALYLSPLNLDRLLFVGTCAIYFGMLNAAKMPIFAATGQFEKASPLFALQFLPLVIAGALTGLWLNRKMSDVWFMRIVYFATFLLGIYILCDGVHGLVAATHVKK